MPSSEECQNEFVQALKNVPCLHICASLLAGELMKTLGEQIGHLFKQHGNK